MKYAEGQIVPTKFSGRVKYRKTTLCCSGGYGWCYSAGLSS